MSMCHQFKFIINNLLRLLFHIYPFIRPSIYPLIHPFFSPKISCRQQCTSFLNTSSVISLTGVQYFFVQNLYFTQERLTLYIYFAKRKGCDSRRINTIHGWFLLGYLWKWEAVWELVVLKSCCHMEQPYPSTKQLLRQCPLSTWQT